jgi:glycosyltransferase involved in cell wall biosynthesis
VIHLSDESGEPFGLVMVEALACGTPVIATPCGAAPELIEHDTTGYLAATPEELRRAINAINNIDRCECRRHAEQRFTMERMALDHDTFYRAAIHHFHNHRRTH